MQIDVGFILFRFSINTIKVVGPVTVERLDFRISCESMTSAIHSKDSVGFLASVRIR